MGNGKEMESLVEVIKSLRGPGGCPWDREQNHDSIKPCLIEETYETIEAIESGDPDKLKEELGDLLLQIVFHANLAEEAGKFNIDDVITTIREKMIRRHPHLFGEGKADNATAVLKQWEDIKSKEKGNEERKSTLEGIPKGLPSLIRAHRIQERAARVGFDWDNIDDVFAKVEEEMGEFREAFLAGKTEEIEAEMGDLFFALVNIARFIEINPDDALKKTIVRFAKRFRHIEERLAEGGKTMVDTSLAEMDKLWAEAKELEREKTG